MIDAGHGQSRVTTTAIERRVPQLASMFKIAELEAGRQVTARYRGGLRELSGRMSFDGPSGSTFGSHHLFRDKVEQQLGGGFHLASLSLDAPDLFQCSQHIVRCPMKRKRAGFPVFFSEAEGRLCPRHLELVVGYVDHDPTSRWDQLAVLKAPVTPAHK